MVKKFERVPNGKTLLFLGGPVDCVPALGKAWTLGYSVWVIDGDKDCPGLRWVKSMKATGKKGIEGALGSVYHFGESSGAAKILSLRLNQKINGVLAVATDVGPVVSQVAEFFNLPHIPEAITQLSWDKPELKRVLKAGGIPVPGSADFVVKPAYQGRGARGVTVVEPEKWFSSKDDFVKLARENSADKSVMYESFINGPQISCEAIVWEGEPVLTVFTDRDYSKGFPVECGGSGPVSGQILLFFVRKVVKVLGLESGTIKLDLVLDAERDNQPTVIEAAVGRLSGGLMCSHMNPLISGYDFLAAAFSISYGEDPRPHLGSRKPIRYFKSFYQNKKATIHRERGKFRMVVGRDWEEVKRKICKYRE